MTQMQEVEKQLRQMILAMDLGPGERLTERWAEARFGASRTPVRAALMRLETEGLVCREGRGWMVAPIDLAEVEQLFVYREVLETAAARLAAAAPDAQAIGELAALLDACSADASPEQAHDVGTDFHVRLAQLSGNDFIARGVADAMNRLARARWLESSDPTHEGWGEHRAILAALKKKDAEKAARLVQAHVRESRDRLLAALRSGPRSLRARGVRVA